MANKKGKKKGVVALIIFTILCLLVMGGGVAYMLIDGTLSWEYPGVGYTVQHALKVDVLDALVFNNSELAFLLYVGIAIYAYCLLFLIAFIVSLIRRKKRLLIPAVIGTIAGEVGIAFFLLYNEFFITEAQAAQQAAWVEAMKLFLIEGPGGLHNWLFLALAGVLALLGLITLLIEIFCPASWAKKKAAEEAEPEAEEKAEEEAKPEEEPEEEKVEEKPEEKEEEKPVEEKKLCPDCGEAVTDEMKECPSCGRKLKEEPAPAPIIVNVTTPEDKDSVSHDEMNRAIEEALAKDRAERKAAEEEAAKKKAEEEAARKAEEEEAARKAEEEEKKKAEEEAARKAAEEEAARKKTIKETQLREMVREEIRRKKEAEKAEKERAAAERKAKAEEERKAKAEADRKAKEEAEKKAKEEEAARALAEARAAAEEARKAAEEARKAAAAPAVAAAAPEVKEAKTPGKYEVYPEAGFYKYRLKANNGEILIVSNSYKTKISAHAGIATLQRNVQGGTYKIITDKSGYSQFRIFTGNDARLIVAGEFYPTPAGAESAYQSVLKFYLTERIVDLDEIPENEVREWRVQFEDVEELDTGRVEVFMEDNKFRARLLASNSELLFLTATYASKAGVLSAIDKIKEKFASGRDVTIVKDKQQRYQFIVYANNGAILIMGESYDAKTKAESAAHSVKRFLGKAAIVDQTKA